MVSYLTEDGRIPWDIKCLAHGWHLNGGSCHYADFFAVARNMRGNETRQVKGTATGEPGCPMGTPTRGAMNTEKDTARSESVTLRGSFSLFNAL